MRYKIENFTITFFYGDFLKIEMDLDAVLNPFLNIQFPRNDMKNNIKYFNELTEMFIKFNSNDIREMYQKSKTEANIIYLWGDILNKLLREIIELEICGEKQLYFMQNYDGLIKIGISNNPDIRLKTLKNQLNEDIVIIKTLPFANYEKELHKKYHCYNAYYKGYTEWFTPYPDLLEFIESVNESNFEKNFKKIKPKYAKEV